MALLKQRWPYENTPLRVTDNKKVKVAEFRLFIGDYEEINGHIREWAKSDLGKFVLENSKPDITIHSFHDVSSLSVRLNIVAYFYEQTNIFYNLKYK